jgi:hypothetical protein
MRISEITSPKTQKPLTAAQARIKALNDQAKRARDAVKAERARQSIASSQKQIANLLSKKN